MRSHPKKLSLSRETVRQLAAPALGAVKGGINATSHGCGSLPPTMRHSCFDSCYQSQCCLEVP